jgi:hypothetical protein
MFSKIRNSWALILDSAAVLRADKELIVFPIISALVELVVILSFILPVTIAGVFDSVLGGRIPGFGLLAALAFYGVQSYVAIFANSALIGAAMIRLRGGDPTVGDGIRIAAKHAASIFAYSLLSGIAGTILRWLAKRGKTLGRFASAIGGLAWELATYLALPVLVVEGVGPIEAITRSATLLKKTWGEQIVGNLSAGAVFGLLKLVVLVLAVLAFAARTPLTSPTALALTVVLAVSALVFIGLIESALNGIYVAAVYRYAAEGEAGGYFDEAIVKGAFRPKQ